MQNELESWANWPPPHAGGEGCDGEAAPPPVVLMAG
jgi:hypothetical protein